MSWSRKYEKCTACGRSDRRHCGRGLCEICYCAQRRRNKGQLNKKTICEHKFIDGVESAYCRHCQQWKSLDQFQAGNRRRDGLKSFCKDCAQIKEKRQTLIKVERKNKRKLQIFESQNGCGRCGTQLRYMDVYDLHHIDSETKEETANQWLCRASNRWIKEIQKCLLVCANCHALIHRYYERNSSYYENDKYGYSRKADVERRRARSEDRKLQILQYQGGCKVCECMFDYMGVYDFHHLDRSQKEHKLSRILTQANDVWMKEVQKCILVCTNCHRLIHQVGIEKAKKVMNKKERSNAY